MAESADIKTMPRIEVLLDENLAQFNQMVAEGRAPELRGANLSNLDLRGANLKGLDMAGAYLRNANLKGVDLSGCNLKGASLRGAQVSGTLFPENLGAEEIRLSLEMGTRLRTREDSKNLRLVAALAGEIYKMAREQYCPEAHEHEE